MTRKRLIFFAIAAILVTVTGVSIGLYHNHSAQSPSAKNTHETKGGDPAKNGSIAATKNATSTSGGQTVTKIDSGCSGIFSDLDARQILGDSSTADAGNGITTQDTNSKTSTCAYSAGSDHAKVVVNVAITSVGASMNEVHFGSGQPSGALPVDGFGSTAFWLASSSELHILKDNNWYIVSGTAQTDDGALQNAQHIATVARLAANQR